MMAGKKGINQKPWMTEGNKVVYRAIIDYCIKNNGTPPTFREIREETGLSLGGVTHHIGRLCSLGYLCVSGSRIKVNGSKWIPPEA